MRFKWLSTIHLYEIPRPWFAAAHAIPLCNHCKFFVKDSPSTYGQCTKFPLSENKHYVYVYGTHDEYYRSSVARKFDDMCGKDGDAFQPRNGNVIS
jgi:hypothetical protein